MAKLTKEQKDYIRKDWIDAVIANVLDPEYYELSGKEFKAWITEDPTFNAKLKADIEEFATLVIQVREAQAKRLLDRDPAYFAYLNDPVKYVKDFATYHIYF